VFVFCITILIYGCNVLGEKPTPTTTSISIPDASFGNAVAVGRNDLLSISDGNGGVHIYHFSSGAWNVVHKIETPSTCNVLVMQNYTIACGGVYVYEGNPANLSDWQIQISLQSAPELCICMGLPYLAQCNAKTCYVWMKDQASGHWQPGPFAQFPLQTQSCAITDTFFAAIDNQNFLQISYPPFASVSSWGALLPNSSHIVAASGTFLAVNDYNEQGDIGVYIVENQHISSTVSLIANTTGFHISGLQGEMLWAGSSAEQSVWLLQANGSSSGPEATFAPTEPIQTCDSYGATLACGVPSQNATDIFSCT